MFHSPIFFIVSFITLAFIFLDIIVCADITNDSSVWIVMRHLLDVSIAIYYHAIAAPFARVREKVQIILSLS